MSYTPTEWKNGDTITAEKLNKIEEGIEDTSNTFIINYEYANEVDILDKTYNEIKMAALSGKNVICVKNDSWDDPEYGYTKYTWGVLNCFEEQVGIDNSSYYVTFENLGTFFTDGPNDYPHLTD